MQSQPPPGVALPGSTPSRCVGQPTQREGAGGGPHLHTHHANKNEVGKGGKRWEKQGRGGKRREKSSHFSFHLPAFSHLPPSTVHCSGCKLRARASQGVSDS